MKLLSMFAVVVAATFAAPISAGAGPVGRVVASPSVLPKPAPLSPRRHGRQRHDHGARWLAASGMAGVTISPPSIDEPELASGEDRARPVTAPTKCFRPMLVHVGPVRRAAATPRLSYGAAPRC